MKTSDLLAIASCLALLLMVLLMASCCAKKPLPVCRPGNYTNCYWPSTFDQWVDMMNEEEKRQINDESRRYGL